MGDFSDIMTAWLAQPELTAYFTSIERRRVEPMQWKKPFPLLAVWVTDDEAPDDAGDNRFKQLANYTIVAAARLEAAGFQDKLLAEMTALLRAAAKDFIYSNVDGISADATLGSWFSEDNTGSEPASLVWLTAPLRFSYS
jgi:hypothetical protein